MSQSTETEIECLAPTASIGACSRGMLEVPHLTAFLGGRPVTRLGRGAVSAVAGWGNKTSGRVARTEAARRNVPLVLLEDGFIRSVGLGKLGAPPVSLVLDDIGIYFDASGPSRLERLLVDLAWLTPALRGEAELGLQRWRHERLSKYNLGRERAVGDSQSRHIVLIDQVKGDASVPGALASAASFARMFDDALATYGAARLAVRSHPDVIAGMAKGYLVNRARSAGVSVLDPELSTHAALDGADAIWTVSSAIGFEAILRGIPVVTYGVPFYAGFGLSDDKATGDRASAAFARRSVSRTDIEIFAAAFLAYARYADPVSKRACSLDAAIDRLIDWRHRAGALACGPTTAFGFSRWKRASASIFLGGGISPIAYAGKARAGKIARAKARGATRIAVWGTTDADGFEHRARATDLGFIRVEDGFIRSVGLGSDLRPAGSLVLDDLGIYYDARRPSRLEAIIETGRFDARLLQRAQRVRARLIANAITKYNLGPADIDVASAANGRAIVLVTEQVPGDASLRFGSGAISNNLDLLRAVRDSRPDACIVYKEHPDVVAGNRKGRLSAKTLQPFADIVASRGDIASFFAIAEEVHVISSLAGFEALCRGTKVVVWGKPFYAGWGLTDDRETIPRRTRRATLDELVAATLIEYPRYVDPVSGVPCSIEDYLDNLDAARAAGPLPVPHGGIVHQLKRFKRWLRT